MNLNILAPLPDLVVYAGCDTTVAINLEQFGLSSKEEFYFVVKNFDYAEAPIAYKHSINPSKVKVNSSGDTIFTIKPEDCKAFKPGAFYYFAMLNTTTKEVKKLTSKGKIVMDYSGGIL